MKMGKSKATATHSLLILSTRSKPERVAAISPVHITPPEPCQKVIM